MGALVSTVLGNSGYQFHVVTSGDARLISLIFMQTPLICLLHM